MSKLTEFSDRKFLFFQKTWTLWLCMGIFTTPIPEFWLVTFPFHVNRTTLQKSCKWILFVQQKWYLTCKVNPCFMTCNTWLSTHHSFWCWLDEDLVGQNAFAGGHYTPYPQGHSQMYWLYEAHVNTNKWFEDIYK
jgi:hypothetical protein